MVFWNTFLAEAPVADEHEALVASVRYQLSRLLESEAPLTTLPAKLAQVERSNMRFGLDCLQSISSQMDKDQFARQLESWIKSFEPRLVDVSVEVYERDETNNAINFSLLARLKTDRGLHALVFDSNMNLADQKVDMEGQDLV
ncbi:type VI secretion system baseplate subunit TssE [Marinobacterium arenosum]|uniref:type VI secretion system baseplate subunit TssE n=1 Tax=Marinobacterium arenosum TaxID=2862496 RepID=UPI001C970493|nr:type VI secretion system baseplate subunit TssE [Marinobacterium arenosum]MBY4677081.1 type VI secretion system baseplate subunit TssE [Marinobacterium arenosum]